MNLAELIAADIKAVTEALVKDANKIRLAAFNTVKGDISRRVFQQGIASDGSKIGQYKTSTKKFRNLVGRRIDTVDLQLTGTLKDALVVGQDKDNRVVMGFIETAEPKVSTKGKRKQGFATLRVTGKTDFMTNENAIEQEKNFNKSIFAPTDAEVEKSLKIFERQAQKTISAALGGNKTTRIKVTKGNA